MLVAQILAVAVAASGAAAANLVPGTLEHNAPRGPRRLDTEPHAEALDKRGDWDNGYYGPALRAAARRAFDAWTDTVFTFPTIGNYFVTASYVNYNIFCPHTEQRATYQGAEYVLYSFGCGALFWSKWPALGISSVNCRGNGGGSNTGASVYCW